MPAASTSTVPPVGSGGVGRPGDQAGSGVVRGVRQHGVDGPDVLLADPGEQGDLGLVGQGCGDPGDLVGGLALAEHRLRVAAALLAIEVQLAIWSSPMPPDRQPWWTATRGNVNAPDCIPARSRVT